MVIRSLMPLGGLQKRLQDELSSIDDLFGEVFSQNDAFFGWNSLGYPKCNMIELDDKFVIELAVAGLDKGDLSMKIEGPQLIVTGQKKSKYENTKYHVKELSDRSFRRFITLPSNVDKKAINAKFDNGILEINLPKRESDKDVPNEVKID
jgi:HSP20 family protein